MARNAHVDGSVALVNTRQRLIMGSAGFTAGGRIPAGEQARIIDMLCEPRHGRRCRIRASAGKRQTPYRAICLSLACVTMCVMYCIMFRHRCVLVLLSIQNYGLCSNTLTFRTNPSICSLEPCRVIAASLLLLRFDKTNIHNVVKITRVFFRRRRTWCAE